MNRRPLGKTGITVSEIGLGCWQLANPAWGKPDVDEALRIVAKSFDAGCDFFDTAPGYSKGRSEEILGQALQSVRDKVTLCTKFGHDADGKTDFSAAALAPSLEGSLRRLRTDHVDVLLLHNPPTAMKNAATAPELHRELERLKSTGKLRAYGVSLDSSADLQTIADHTQCMAAEVFFNALHQETRNAFAAAHARGIGLIIKVPLDSGWLSGKYRGDSKFTDVRERWKPEVIARRAALVEQFAALTPPGVPLSHSAMQYILAHPEVSTLIPGARTAEQALDNYAASPNRLPANTVTAITRFWEKELRETPVGW